MTSDRWWEVRALVMVGTLASCEVPSKIDIRSDARTEVEPVDSATFDGLPMPDAMSTRVVDAQLPPDGSAVPDLAPDLTLLCERMEASIVIRSEFIDGTSCALDKCLTAFGVRRLLRFETAAFNAGTAALVLGPPQPSHPHWDHDSCDVHHQVRDFASYQLVDAHGAVVAVGHKQSYCVRDDIEVTPGAPSSGFDCQHQGLSPGWADVHANHRDCQYVDITDVAPGNYLLRVELNPERWITEANYANNVATFPVVVE